MAANCHHASLAVLGCKAKVVLPLGELKGGKKRKRKEKKKTTCLASLTAFG